jgi:membrane-associated phospholipid phosphatase
MPGCNWIKNPDDVMMSLLPLIADAVNPAALALLFIVVMKWGWDWKRKLNFLARSLGAIVISGVLAHINRYIEHGVHFTYWPSGHMTFYSVISTSFFLLVPRSVFYTLPAGLMYGYLMVFLGFHDWPDLLGGMILGISVALLIHSIADDKKPLFFKSRSLKDV